MAPSHPRRTDRIELRTTPEEKRLLLSAAAHERLDLTSFVLHTALPAARKVIERAERLELSERDSLRVLELLENPPEPSPALLQAAARRMS